MQPLKNANAPVGGRGKSSQIYLGTCSYTVQIIPEKSSNVKLASAVITARELLKYTIDLLITEPWTPQVSSTVDHCALALDALQKEEPHA